MTVTTRAERAADPITLEIIQSSLQATSDEEKAAQHATALGIFTDQLPSLPLFARAKVSVVRPGVEGVIMDPTINSEMWNVENFNVTTPTE